MLPLTHPALEKDKRTLVCAFSLFINAGLVPPVLSDIYIYIYICIYTCVSGTELLTHDINLANAEI